MKFSIVLSVGLVTGAVAGGCKKHDPAGAARPATCDEIAAKAGQVKVQGKAAEEMSASQQRNAALIGQRVVAALRQVCQEDAWSPELRACIGAVEPGDTPARCQAMLTATQRDHVATAMQRAYGEGQQAVLGDMVDVGSTVLGVLGAVAAAGEPRPEPTCEAIAALALKDDRASEIAWVREQAAADAALIERLCKEDAWTKPAIACSMSGGKLALCVDQFTPAQMRRLGIEQCKLTNPTAAASCEAQYDSAADAGASK